MIDSHCHLTATDFSSDIDAVIARAISMGVQNMVTISDEENDFEKCRLIAEKYEQIFYTLGVHPHHASSVDLASYLPRLHTLLSHPKCKAVGEIGLDYHYMNSPKDAQQRVFEAQLVVAKEHNLPAVVHCRDAVEDVWTIVNHVKPKKLVIHCCTEKYEDVARFVDAGYFLSFTGIVTYPKAEDIRETVRRCPFDQLMIETDAPYLAPVPLRGKRCEPMHVLETAKTIATLKQCELQECSVRTSQNARNFFGLPASHS